MLSGQDMLVIEGEAAAEQIGADPAFAALDASGAPIAAALGDPPTIVYLNESARAVFGDDLAVLSERLFRGEEPGAHRLAELAASAKNGSAPRLERLRFSFGPVAETVTILCRKTQASDTHPGLFVIAALGLRAPREAQPEPVAEHASIPALAVADEPPIELREAEPLPAENSGLMEPAAPEPEVNAPFEAAAPEPEAPKAKAPRPERFLWRSDAAGRVVEVTSALADLVGREHGDIVGRDLIETARSLRLDPQNRLAEALAARRSWSGIELDWPAPGARVPVTLGALPVLDEARRFAGFQGYGVLHVDRLREEPPEPEPAPPPSAEIETEIAPPPLVDYLPPEPLPVSAKVVPLRPPAPRAEEAETAGELLSALERAAFDEIARTLSTAGQHPKGSVRNLFETLEQATGRDARADSLSGPGAGALLDHLPVGVLVARGAQALYANRTLLDYLGYADLDALRAEGGPARLFVAPRLQDAAEATGLVELRGGDGEAHEADARLQTIDWDGAPATLVTLRAARPAFQGVEPARLAALQSELGRRRREADELRAVLEANGDGVAILDRDGKIRSANKNFARAFAKEAEALTGAGLATLFGDSDNARVADYLRQPSMADSEEDSLRVSARGAKGEPAPFQLRLAPLGGAGERRGVILREFRRRRSDDELDAARREAERANAAKSDFLAKVSHEIRTPLNAIIGFAEVMMEERFGPIGAERYKEYLKDIHTSGAHVLSIVNDLLDLSKIEAGKMELDVERIDANAVITECVSIMQPQANRSRVVMRLSLWPRLPRILADGRSLRQILLNLLSNAVKFNEAGGQVIVSTALTDAGYVVIRVKDTGIGMSESEIETALEPFRQVSASRRANGTGLGLPVTKALIEANHAAFSIKSRKSEGTLVEVAFPPPQVLAAE